MSACYGRADNGQGCDLAYGHDGPHEGCHAKGHGPTCEGKGMHIRARCATGCPQFQDGSWMARGFCVRQGTPHPPLPGHPQPEYGEADAALDWLAANGIGSR